MPSNKRRSSAVGGIYGEKSSEGMGMFMGIVKDNIDAQSMGRLRIWIPEFGGAESDENSWTLVNYCSPFAGATPHNSVTKDGAGFSDSQNSYGMWFVPPDLENQVFAFFINGNLAQGFWFGCAFQNGMNNSVPDMNSEYEHLDSDEASAYNGLTLPTSEVNKTISQTSEKPLRALHMPRVKGIAKQGLIRDRVRGLSSSSARRGARSNAYGIKTPGPSDPNSKDLLGRLGGSSLIMDDAEGNEHISLRTRSGSQIRIDESNGLIYVINRDGTGWIQIDEDGNGDIFLAKDLSLRASQDFNIRADRDVNIEAGANINIKSAMDNTGGAGEGVGGTGSGSGGIISIESLSEIHVKSHSLTNLDLGDTSIITASMNVASEDVISLHGTGDVNLLSDGNMNITGAGGASFSSDGNANVDGAMVQINGGASTAATAATTASAAVKGAADLEDNLVSFADENDVDRNTQTVSTVTTRMPTFEPYNGHGKK